MATSKDPTVTATKTESWLVASSNSNLYNYQTVGPLTTIFTPPPQCTEAFAPLGFGTDDICNPVAYSADCKGERSSRTQDHAPAEMKNNASLDDTTSPPVDQKKVDPENKPELDAISTVRISGPVMKPELPATPLPTQSPAELMSGESFAMRHELEGEPVNEAAADIPLQSTSASTITDQTGQVGSALEAIASQMV
ncbi:hypothetical protein B0T21DRAFT_407486 [Apiosordaria backusii]|uniref:Uncharacterized protein n=1 Tax=Apiosordaria backusii TaxID=314023 RepID=A0AA40K3J6_9PEZI|nr:hypothetical protein B0T21DRAFT_407486 [Apiosordaria backusii]